MLRLIAAAALLAVSCTSLSATGSHDRLALEYNVGEQLMNDCSLRNVRCLDWLDFKKAWEKDVDYLTTFEKSLKRWRKRNP